MTHAMPAAEETGLVLDHGRGVACFGGVRIELDAAAYEVLAALVEADGAVLDAAAFRHRGGTDRLWARVARLNDALARCSPRAGHVANFPGLGYQLVAGRSSPRPVLGRAAELARVAGLLERHRFVTIVGPGGMGKTTLGRVVAASCAPRYPDGVRFIDLAVLAEGRELAAVLGNALGIAQPGANPLAQIASCLRGQRMLILLDCCEHHTAVAAQVSEALLRAAPGIHVLCTSREPLLAHGEQVIRLGPIGLPEAGAAPAAAAAAHYPAVALFVARANIDNPAGFALEEENVALVCEICQALDGVPLALELAAAAVRDLGLARLARQTSRCLLDPAPAPGPGSAHGRHRTIASMLDWSYDALSPEEQGVLRCLAVFRGGFTLEAAGAVAAADGQDADSVLDTVIELASKSLVSMQPDGGTCGLRLLDVTREYVFDKLVRGGELDAVQQRHARWLGNLMERLERDWMALPRGAWVDLYSPWLDDILAAIDWALAQGGGGQTLLGAQLAAVGCSLGDQIGVTREFQDCVRRALAALDGLENVPAALLLRLNAVSVDGNNFNEQGWQQLRAEAENNLRLARETGVTTLQSAPMMAIWGWPFVRGNYPVSLTGAQQLARAAEICADPYFEVIGQRTMAQSLHFLGRHAEARHWAMLALSNSGRRIPLQYQPSPVQVGTSIRIVLARLLWMEGAADQAVTMSEAALLSAESDRPVATCQVLCMASVPVALWRGETARAAQLVARLRERAERHGLGYWIDWAARYEDALAVIAGTVDAASRSSHTDTREVSAKCRDHLATFAPDLLSADAIVRCDSGKVGWCAPELLRVQALRQLAAGGPGADGAALLRQSVALALEQGAPAWALRSATSLAALELRQGAEAQARATLAPILARCREGRETADLRAAHALLARIG